MQKLTYIPMLLLLALLFSCGNSQNKPGLNLVMGGTADSAAMIAPQYAKGFNVKYANNIWRLMTLRIRRPNSFILPLLTRVLKERFPMGTLD